jgi:hypothetical protein
LQFVEDALRVREEEPSIATGEVHLPQSGTAKPKQVEIKVN